MTASGLTITLMAIAALAAWVSTAEGGGWPPPREAAAEGSRARVVARHALRADTVLTAEDLAVTGGAEASDPRARMVGLRLRHPIAAGSPVGQRDLAAPFLVRRKERVRIVFSTGALTITGVG
ncbi:MAG: flagella basal body P-ring formation protein FlgA, partial [Pseudomonadota bacterium]